MTPDTAEEVLYDDILNLENAREQHAQLSGVLQKVSQPLEVNDLLIDILKNSKVHDANIREAVVFVPCSGLLRLGSDNKHVA